MIRCLQLCVATLTTALLVATAALRADSKPEAATDEVARLVATMKGSDLRAFFGAAMNIEQQLAKKDKAADELAAALLKQKTAFVTNVDVVKMIDGLVAAGKQATAAEVLMYIAQGQQTVKALKRGHVIVGQVVVADHKTSPEMVMAQMPILPDGYFAGPVGDLQRPVGFRAQGCENLDVPLAGKEGDVVYVGTVTLKPLSKDHEATLKGKLVLDGAKTADSAQVRLMLGVAGINTPHNGYSPRRRWPDPITASVDAKGEFTVSGLCPSQYYLQVQAKDHTGVSKTVEFKAGEVLDLGEVRLMSTDLGFYIGQPAPKTEELKWEKDYASALKRAQAEKKPMLVMMTATWCGWCKKLEHDTLSDPWVRHFLSGFVLVKAFEDKDVEKKYGCGGYPTLVFTDSEGKLIHKTVGYEERLSFSTEVCRAYTKMHEKLPVALKTLVAKKVIHVD